MINIALSIAKKAHAGQVDKAGTDYIKHPIYVARQVTTNQEKAVALEYLEKVKSNNLARVVKLVDLKHNSDLSRLKSVTDTDFKRIKKYKNAIQYLST